MTLFSSSAFPLPWASGCWECLAEPNTPPLADPCSYIAWPEPNRRSRNVRPTNSKTVPTECFVNIVLFLALPPHSLNTLFLQCIFVHWDMSLVWRPLSKLWRLFLWVYRPDCFEQILILRRHGGYLWLKACKKKATFPLWLLFCQRWKIQSGPLLATIYPPCHSESCGVCSQPEASPAGGPALLGIQALKATVISWSSLSGSSVNHPTI